MFLLRGQSFAQSTTFSSGTAIIDMGSASPTVQNSLKPYGLIYGLLKTKRVPVSVVINSTKVKDGIDFVYNGKNYKGGTFIISADYISSDVTNYLNSWANQGVSIDYTTASAGDLTVNVTYKINFAPKWVMDKSNGSIAVGFLNAAGIPSSAYSFKDPSELGNCDDIFILPHADPTWNTHNNLFFWNKNNKGAIWAGCHAVSVLESLSGTDPGTGSTVKMNFLSSNGLVPFTDHKPTATPFTNLLPGDPVAQYYNKTDNAQLFGSETVYLPKSGSAWNAGAKIITTSPSQSDVPSLSPGVAVENIYGRAFDDASRGYVAYQASHNIGGSSADQIAAQRIFFNFSLYALTDKVPPIISASLSGNSSQITSGSAASLTATVTGSGTGLTYQWSSTFGGTFSAATSATTTFTPNSVTSATTCIITCVVTESCGRVSFDSKKITIVPPPSSYTPLNRDTTISVSASCTNASVKFNVFTNNPDPSAGARTLLSVTGLGNGTVVTSTNGDITFTSVANFKGKTTGTYIVTNGAANSASANISIIVGDSTLAPSVTTDAITTMVDSLTVINVLANDKYISTASGPDSLYIRDISTKPTKGYVYINTNGTLSYISTKDPSSVSGGDTFQYLACNSRGYCSVGTVNVTLVQDGCAAGQYQLTTTGTTTSNSFTPTADTYIQSGATGTASGSATTMLVYGASGNTLLDLALIKFDLSSLSTSATVNSSILSITATTGFAISSSNSFNPANVYSVSRAWTESATWLTYDGTNSWTGTGSTGLTSGSDYSTSNSVTIVVTSAVAANQVLSTTEMKNMVSNWISTPSSNNGLVIIPTFPVTNVAVANRPAFHSNNSASPGKVPKLFINYTTPAACFTIPTTFKPIVYPDTVSTKSNTAVTINVKSNDANYYGNTNSVTSVTTPANGTASINGSNNVVYTPNGSFIGTDTLTYTITDGTNGKTNTATVRITVSKVAPTIVRDNASTNSNTAVTINVGSNDTDPQGSITAPTITSLAKNGTATVSGNNIVYTPLNKFKGNDTLIYTRSGTAADACSSALSDTALVVITVLNQAPTAVNDTTLTFACTPVTIKIKSNDTDPEGDNLTVTIVSNPSNGSIAANADGSYTYTPNTNFTGTDQFTYYVTDQGGLTSNTVTVFITISSAANPNTAPSAVADSDNTFANQPVYTNVLANDSDPNNDPFTISITASGLKAPSNGTIQLMANNLVKYIPNANFTGTDTYQYQITDTHPSCSGSNSQSAIALVTITVKPPPILAGGTIWNDLDYSANETFNNIQTNAETGTNVNGSIYVYLTDSTNTILELAPVDEAGVYQLSSVPSNTAKLNLILSTQILSIGGTLSTPSLPSGYVNTSPSVRTFSTGTVNITGYDFGIVATSVTGGTITSTISAVCTGGTPGLISSTVDATGGISLQWQSSTTSGGSGFTNITGANSTSYTPNTPITSTTWYRRKALGSGNAYNYSNAVMVKANALPTLSISPANPLAVNNGNVSFTASGADTYSWSPSTGLTSTNTAAVTAGPITAVTAYIVTGTVAATGCVNSATVTVTILNAGVIGSDQSNCGTFVPNTLTSTTDASGSTGPISYQWQSSTVSDFSTGITTISGATSSTYSPGSVSATTYYRRVATSNGVSVNSNVVTVTIKTFPVATAGSNSPLLPGGTLNLTSSGGISYSWSGPNSYNSSLQNPSLINVTGSAGGTYMVAVTGSNGCSSTATTLVTVNDLVPGNIGIQTLSNTVLANTYCGSATSVVIIPTSLNAGGTIPYKYQWQSSTDNTTFTDIVGATDSAYTSGTITSSLYIRRQVIAGIQSKFSNSVYVQIYTLPVKPVIAGTASLIVGKANVTLTSTTAVSYKWSTSETTRSIVTPIGGNYTVTITDANGCSNTSAAYIITTLDPNKVADIQKVVSKAPVLQSDGSLVVGFTFLSSNLRGELLDTVRIKDDLSKVFPSTVDYQVTQILASGKLKANALYNGNSQIDLLSDVSQLPGLTTDSVQVYLRVNPNGFSGKLNNTAILTATSPFGAFSITSNDPREGNGVSVRNPTPFIIPIIDIFIPSGFSPNHDGVNDNFVIIRPFGTTINLEIFNRWGNAVYKAADYKNEWDGRGNQPNNILGQLLPDGTYYYIATATDKFTGTIRKFAGFVTLKR